MKRALIACLLLASVAQAQTLVTYQIQFVDEFDRPKNIGSNLSVYVYQTGTTTEISVYKPYAGRSFQCDQPITTTSTNTPIYGNTDTIMFSSAWVTCDVVITDGAFTRTLTYITPGRTSRLMWPSFGRDWLEEVQLDDLSGSGDTEKLWSADKVYDELATKQDLDNQLSALSDLVPESDKAIYWTGSDTASLFTITSFMRTLMGDPNSADARSTLGLVIGSDVQAYDPNLMSLATFDVLEDGFVDGNDTAYGVSWDGNINAPSMNAVYDKIESLHAPATLGATSTSLLDLTGQEVGLDNQTANRVFAGPATGAAATPTFRALVSADIPDISSTYQAADSDLTDLADGTLSKSKVQDSGNWDTAYGWGNHASAGYQAGDADLTTWAGLTPSTYFQTLINDADANDLRPSLELGYINVKDYPYLAKGDGVNDDTAEIEAAVAACPFGGTVYFPPGNYVLTDEIDVPDHITLRGSGDISSVLIQTTADKAIIRGQSDSNTSYVFIESLRFQATATGCYGIRGPSTLYYWGSSVIERCYFDVDLAYPIDVLAAHTSIQKCQFGRSGTPGAVFTPITIRGTNSTVQYANAIIDCFIEQAVGGSAAVVVETGDTLVIGRTTFETLAVPALYARGCWQIRFADCTIENVDPTSGDEVLFNIGEDASSNSVILRVDHCRITQGTGDTTALAQVETGSTVSFENCRIVAADNYWTQRAGPIYDSRIVFLRGNWDNLLSPISGAVTTFYGTSLFDDGLGIGNGADGGGFLDLYEDDDNGSNKITLASGSAIGADRTYDLLTTGFVKCIIKTIDLDDDASTDDYQLDDDAADTTEQVVTLTGIIPAYAELISVQLRCFETVTGSAAMSIDMGTTSGGNEIFSAANIDSANDINAGPVGHLGMTNAARNLYVNATPGANWDTLDAGRWSVILTYIDYGAVHTQKNP